MLILTKIGVHVWTFTDTSNLNEYSFGHNTIWFRCWQYIVTNLSQTSEFTITLKLNVSWILANLSIVKSRHLLANDDRVVRFEDTQKSCPVRFIILRGCTAKWSRYSSITIASIGRRIAWGWTRPDTRHCRIPYHSPRYYVKLYYRWKRRVTELTELSTVTRWQIADPIVNVYTNFFS